MSRVRIVGGSIETLVEKLNAQLGTPLDAEEVAQLKREQATLSRTSGTLSDPAGMLEDALGRFEEVPDRASTKKRARELIREYQLEDVDNTKVRFIVPSNPNLDVVIVCHPTPEVVKGVLGEDISVDRYLVFGREYQGTRKMVCYTCDNARNRGSKALPHKCFKGRTWQDWEPMVFAWAHGLDDAEDLAKELRSSWQATAEQVYGDNNRDWSAETEIPFSGEWQAGYLAGKGGSAWTTQGN